MVIVALGASVLLLDGCALPLPTPATRAQQCAEIPSFNPSARPPFLQNYPVVMTGGRNFVCPCPVGNGLAGGDEPSKLVGGEEGGRLAGGNEGGKLAGGNEGGKLTGGNEGGKLAGGNEGGKLAGGDEAGKLAVGNEGGKLVGGNEDLASRGAAGAVACQINAPECNGLLISGISGGFDVSFSTTLRHSEQSCVAW